MYRWAGKPIAIVHLQDHYILSNPARTRVLFVVPELILTCAHVVKDLKDNLGECVYVEQGQTKPVTLSPA